MYFWYIPFFRYSYFYISYYLKIRETVLSGKMKGADMKFRILKRIVAVLIIINSVMTTSVSALGADEALFENDRERATQASTIENIKRDDVKVSSRFFELFFGKGNEDKKEERFLYASGEAFGIKIREPYVTVTEARDGSPLMRGDKILWIENYKTEVPEDVKEALKSSHGRPLKLNIIRCGERMTVTATPTEEGGEYKLGIKLRAPASGIGTITYIDPETMEFGGLGHGVTDPTSGECTPISRGDVLDVALGKVARGEAGKPGELSGVLGRESRGSIFINSECGVFGTLCERKIDTGALFPVASRSEIKEGEAEIISTVKNGKTQKYKIEISEIDADSQGSKSFKIKVTDKALITLTGGIVRGMSGSPIIQDGKLVGAVTHVMVADPTEGYGIFIENMLNEAENTVPKAA